MVKTPLPPRPDRLTSSAIRDLLALTQRSDVLSLAGGLPHPSAVPTEAIAQATAEILATDGDAALAYGPTEGHGPLREWIGGRTAMSADGVLVTAGSQQALDLVVRTLAWPGAAIAVADPAYVGALQVIAASGARAVPIPADAHGLRTDVLADLLAGGLRLTAAYVVAGTDNPTGTTLAEDRRRHLVELAERHGFWIVDDDAYGELRWSGPAPAPLRERTDRVLTLGSASKVLSPGLRVGWVTGPDELIAELAIAKQAADLHTGSLTQRVVARVVADEAAFAAHLEGLRARYRSHAAALGDALATTFGDRLAWTAPAGGMFVWADLAPDVAPGRTTAALLDDAVAAGVAFVPGRAFAAGDPAAHDRSLRLSFATAGPDELREAVDRLAVALRV